MRPAWLGFFLVAILWGQVRAQTLHTLDRVVQDRPLTNLTNQGWQFEDIQVDQALVCWGAWPGIRSTQAVWLRDGSWICGDLTLTAGSSVNVQSDWLQSPPLAMERVRGLVLQPPASLEGWIDLHAQMKEASGEQDVVWLNSGRKLAGIIHWPEGDSQNESGFQLEAGSQKIEIATREVRAIAISPALLGRLPTSFQGQVIGLADGTLLRTREMHVDEHRVQFLLDGAVTLTSHDAPSEFATSVRYLLRQGMQETRWLSDLEVARYRFLPDSTLEWELGIDRDLVQRPLTHGTGFLDKGLATHSDSQVTYRWDGSAQKFLAEVVFAEPELGANPKLGSVVCQVMVARNARLETVAKFEMARMDKCRLDNAVVDVDLTGVQLFVLVTQASDFGQLGDHILWLNARVSSLENHGSARSENR